MATLKKGYMEIEQLSGGKGVRITGFDKESREPTGCIETSFAGSKDIASAVAQVNRCMEERGYATVLEYVQVLDEASYDAYMKSKASESNDE